MPKKQRLPKIIKMLLTALLIAGAVGSSGCGTKAPKPPPIDLYIHDVNADLARGATSAGVRLEPVAMALTGGWFMLPPEEFEKVMNYLDLLVCKLDGGCKSADSAELQSVSVRAEDLREFKRKVLSIRKMLANHQRTGNGIEELSENY